MTLKNYCDFFDSSYIYGANNIIRMHSQWPDNKPLPICIQHSYCYDPNEGGQIQDISNRISEVFAVYGDREYDAHIQHGRIEKHNLIKIGSPIFYISKLTYQSSEYNVDERNTGDKTLVFPSHGAGNIKISNFEEYCETLRNLPKIFKPTICLHYHDINDLSKICNKHNITWITIGYPDGQFYIRLLKTINSYKYIISNYTGMPMWTAIYLNKYFAYYGPETIMNNKIHYYKKPMLHENLFNINNINNDINKKIELMKLHLGQKYVLPSNIINKLFHDYCNRDKYKRLCYIMERHGIDIAKMSLCPMMEIRTDLCDNKIFLVHKNSIKFDVDKNISHVNINYGDNLWKLFDNYWNIIYNMDINEKFRNKFSDPNLIEPDNIIYVPMIEIPHEI